MPDRGQPNRSLEGRRRAYGFLRGFIVVSLIVLLTACSGGPDLSGFRASGDPLDVPTEPFTVLDATSFTRVLAGFHGRPVLVNIWASWCGPCRAEAPLLNQAARTGDIDVIGVHGDVDIDAATEFVDEFGITYPNVESDGSSIPELFKSTSFPTTITIGPDGKVRGVTVGGLTEQRLAAMIADAKR